MSKDHQKLEAIFMKSYDEHADALFRFCYFQTSHRETATDLVQETYTKTWLYLKEGKQIDNLRAFLYKVAKNLIIDYRRKKKSHSLDAIMETGVDFADDEADVGQAAVHASDTDFVVGMLEELDEGDREILSMRYINEMSIKEIADTLDLTTNNVSVKIHRAVDKLKRLAQDHYDV